MKSVGDNPTPREVILETMDRFLRLFLDADDTDFRLIRNRRDGPAYLAVRRESDCQSDLLLAVHLSREERKDFSKSRAQEFEVFEQTFKNSLVYFVSFVVKKFLQ